MKWVRYSNFLSALVFVAHNSSHIVNILPIMTAESFNAAQKFENGEEVVDLAVAGQPQPEDGEHGTSLLDVESVS